MYQALYRKWRPMTFDDVVGQDHITEILKSQVRNDRLSHAYLFVGTRGTGKTTCAKILSRAVNCENPIDGNPCNECKSCIGIQSGAIMDVEEMDAASNNGVDNVRALRDDAVFSPASVKKRVYIIDEVHMLSPSAFNALLKILEEPPSHLMFILATTELHKIPATVLSRCQRYSFRRIEPTTVAKRLQTIASGEGLSLADGAAELLARLSEGSMRDAVSLLDQCAGKENIQVSDVLAAMGLAGNSRTAELLGLIAQQDAAKAITAFSELWMDGKEPATLLDELATLSRDIMIYKIAPKGSAALISGGYDTQTLKSLAEQFSSAALLRNLNAIQASQAAMRDSLSPRVTAEMCIITLCSPELGGDAPTGLIERIEKLEAMVSSGNFTTIEAKKPVPEAPRTTVIEQPRAIEPSFADETPPWDEREEEVLQTSPVIEREEVKEEPVVEAEPIEAADVETPDAEAIVGDGESISFESLLPSFKKALSIGTYNIISDDTHTEAVVDGKTLTLYIKNGFSFKMLSLPQAQDSIRAAMSEVLGSGAVLRLEEGSAPTVQAETDKKSIDNLMKFGNVKFE